MAATAPVPDWATKGEFTSITRTADELSIVCPADAVPKENDPGPRWICLKLEGPFPFSQTGVLLSFIQPLSQNGIPIFAISTFDTDYVLVQEELSEVTQDILCAAGHELILTVPGRRRFNMARRRKIIGFVLALVLSPLSAPGQDIKRSLSEDDIQRYLAEGSGCKPEDVSIDDLEYFDFTGDGVDEAVVVASTCATGTAGPDVHTVLSRRPNDSIIEFKIPDPSEKQLAALQGRVFSDLRVENGLLVQTFHDTSGREDPLVIKYRWSAKDKGFQPVDFKMPPRYKTSFDCDKARAGVEAAICYSSELASLDLQVDGMYKRWLDQLNDAQSDVLQKEEKDWLRKRNLTCGSDWAIVECLSILYQARLLELGAFRHLHP